MYDFLYIIFYGLLRRYTSRNDEVSGLLRRYTFRNDEEKVGTQ